VKNKYNLNYAVVAECEAKNDGKVEKHERVIALFDYPFLADDYIKKCLPLENQSKFKVVKLEDLKK
jgi:hypothetical protein